MNPEAKRIARALVVASARQRDGDEALFTHELQAALDAMNADPSGVGLDVVVLMANWIHLLIGHAAELLADDHPGVDAGDVHEAIIERLLDEDY